MSQELAWIDFQACTLSSVERPRRAAEFDAVFAEHLVDVVEESATAAVFRFAGGNELLGTLADLTACESHCCSFFGFNLDSEKDGVRLVVTVPMAHAEVLTALVARATLITDGGGR